jgi:pyruvate dehydrogenase E1 component alpha subunit
MDIIAVHQAVKHAREWALADKGPLLLEFVTYRYGGHSMSDPGTTYRTREEVQRMRSTQDPIKGLQKYIEEWGLASEEELKEVDKKAKQEVDAAVEEAKQCAEPQLKDLWTDIYYAGTEPESMRGREREEVCRYGLLLNPLIDATILLGSSLSLVSLFRPLSVLAAIAYANTKASILYLHLQIHSLCAHMG